MLNNFETRSNYNPAYIQRATELIQANMKESEPVAMGDFLRRLTLENVFNEMKEDMGIDFRNFVPNEASLVSNVLANNMVIGPNGDVQNLRLNEQAFQEQLEYERENQTSLGA